MIMGPLDQRETGVSGRGRDYMDSSFSVLMLSLLRKKKRET